MTQESNPLVTQMALVVDNTYSSQFDSDTREYVDIYLLDLMSRLTTRAQIRRQIGSRKSVQEGKPDRLSDLLDEAANAIFTLRLRIP